MRCVFTSTIIMYSPLALDSLILHFNYNTAHVMIKCICSLWLTDIHCVQQSTLKNVVCMYQKLRLNDVMHVQLWILLKMFYTICAIHLIIISKLFYYFTFLFLHHVTSLKFLFLKYVLQHNMSWNACKKCVSKVKWQRKRRYIHTWLNYYNKMEIHFFICYV